MDNTQNQGIAKRINKMIRDAEKSSKYLYYETPEYRVRLLFANYQNVVTASNTHEFIPLEDVKFIHMFEL
jgi:hypothetical protein